MGEGLRILEKSRRSQVGVAALPANQSVRAARHRFKYRLAFSKRIAVPFKRMLEYVFSLHASYHTPFSYASDISYFSDGLLRMMRLPSVSKRNGTHKNFFRAARTAFFFSFGT